MKKVSKKQQTLNKNFIGAFLELDKLCCEKFNVTANGVTEYINRLNNAKYAEGRDEALVKLVNYRNIRNRFAHEPWYLEVADDLTKADIQWVNDFIKSFKKEKDALGAYLVKARKFAKTMKGRREVKKLKKEAKKAAKKAAK